MEKSKRIIIHSFWINNQYYRANKKN